MLTKISLLIFLSLLPPINCGAMDTPPNKCNPLSLRGTLKGHHFPEQPIQSNSKLTHDESHIIDVRKRWETLQREAHAISALTPPTQTLDSSSSSDEEPIQKHEEETQEIRAQQILLGLIKPKPGETTKKPNRKARRHPNWSTKK